MTPILENIRRKCIEAHLQGVKDSYRAAELSSGYWPRLADVLLAMPPGTYLKTLGEQVRLVVDDEKTAPDVAPITYWNLCADSLDEQSLETLVFINRILEGSKKGYE